MQNWRTTGKDKARELKSAKAPKSLIYVERMVMQDKWGSLVHVAAVYKAFGAVWLCGRFLLMSTREEVMWCRYFRACLPASKGSMGKRLFLRYMWQWRVRILE